MKRFCWLIVGIPLLLIVGGCANAFFASVYTLNPVQLEQDLHPGIPLAIVVAYVAVPEIVDRPQLVLRIGQSQVRVVQAARWSEPLKAQIANVVAADMQQLFRDARVSTSSQPADRPTIRLAINVEVFDTTPGAGAVLAIGWSILTTDSGRVLNGRSVVIQRVKDGGFDALVDAQSRSLGAVSVDMAGAIMSSIEKKPHAVGRLFDAMDNERNGKDTLRAPS